MNKMKIMLNGSALGLVLAMGLTLPALAQPSPQPTISAPDIDFGDDSGEWANDGECDDPRFQGEGAADELLDADRMKDATDCREAFEAGTITLLEADGAAADDAASAPDIDFGDDSSEWANDGECDDPRFKGEGAADELLDADRLKDATDCREAFEAGTVTLVEDGTSPADIDIATPLDAIDFGDDSSDWANDGECDDPRFKGEGAAAELLDADRMKDATDCREAYEAGTVTLVDETASDAATATDIDFGDDSSEWANDGECDDPRFEGTGAASELLDVDRMHDATDCREAYEAGTITLKTGDSADASGIDFGDDTSEWANDEECDDPRFEGTGAVSEANKADLFKDATDCQTAFEDGTVTLRTNADEIVATANEFDYGSDFSRWANDGECDDKRFVGAGMAKKLLSEDMMGDATDCRALVETGEISIIPVFDPAYTEGAPYDASGIDFGDNTSSYANDDQCDDPRFQGPGAASTLLDSDLKHDRDDCKTAFEAGTIVLL